RAGGPQDLHELLVDDPHDVLARAHARGRFLFERPPLQLLRDPEGELDVHVRLDEGPLDVPDDFLDEGLVDVAGPRDLAEGLAERAAVIFEAIRASCRIGGTLSLAV